MMEMIMKTASTRPIPKNTDSCVSHTFVSLREDLSDFGQSEQEHGREGG